MIKPLWYLSPIIVLGNHNKYVFRIEKKQKQQRVIVMVPKKNKPNKKMKIKSKSPSERPNNVPI